MKEIIKSGWIDGPWMTEPDILSFRTADDLHAVIIRNRSSGNLCGYVGVTKSHPWHGKTYSSTVKITDDILEKKIDINKISVLSLFSQSLSGSNEDVRIDCLIQVHGGITYSDNGYKEYLEEPELWYFGFDCAHHGDLCPGYMRDYTHGTYRDIEYVKREIELLSKQLVEIDKASKEDGE